MLRNISDTARLTAIFRALEGERDNPLFHDPLARRLAGTVGQQLAGELTAASRFAWVIAARTALFDRMIVAEVQGGADAVINLAAGFDTRPYRLPLGSHVRWFDVDLPDLIDEKQTALLDEPTVCETRSVPLDVLDRAARREVLRRLCNGLRNVVVVTEGLLIYLPPDEVVELARDLAALDGVRRWILDLQPPLLLRLLQRMLGRRLENANAALQFAPATGPDFFLPHGWVPIEVQSIAQTAAAAGRLDAWTPRPEASASVDGCVCTLGRA